MAEQMTGLHIFDVVRQPTHAPTVLLPWLFTAVCCCGWVSPFQSLRESDSRDDWERHIKTLRGQAHD